MSVIYNSTTVSYSSKISIKNTTTDVKTDNNRKSIDNTLFSTETQDSHKTDEYAYVDKIKNCIPKTTVTVKAMNAADVKKYYEQWKKQPIDYSGFKHDIIVSPKVLEKMNRDPKYAEQMMNKIKDAAIPQGFGNATIYEYKVIVRDDGKIETFACADFMNGKSKIASNDKDDKEKTDRRRLELIHLNKRVYFQGKPRVLSQNIWYDI